MKIVLNHDVGSVGHKGEIVEVSAGYARNYLFPKGLAVVATEGAIKQSESLRQSRAAREKKAIEEATLLAGRVNEASLRFEVQASDDGKMFGSVGAADIAAKLDELLGQTVDRHVVHLDGAIRELGESSVTLRFHPEVTAQIVVEVVQA